MESTSNYGEMGYMNEPLVARIEKYLQDTFCGNQQRSILLSETLLREALAALKATTPEGEANARLTASAPDLLDACKHALFALVGQKKADDGYTVHTTAIRKLSDAIKKAGHGFPKAKKPESLKVFTHLPGENPKYRNEPP